MGGVDEGFEAVKRAIEEINEDEEVEGLIVYFPLFGPEKVDRFLVRSRISD